MANIELNKVDWLGVLQNLGVPKEAVENPRKLGPCPIEGAGKTRFRLENKDGRGNWHCNQCGHGDGVRLVALLQGCSDADAIRLIRSMDHRFRALPERVIEQRAKDQAASKDINKIRNSLHRVFLRAKTITPESPAGIYLKRRVPFLNLAWVSPDLKYVDQLFHNDEDDVDEVTKATKKSWWPAMVSKICDVDGKPMNLHRTYLSKDGYKANVSPSQVKKMMEGIAKMNGQAIHLNVIEGGSRTLQVTEGIETGFAVVASIRNEHEVWSAVNAGNLSRLVVPRDRFDAVVIYADKDPLNPKTGVRIGEHSAQILAKRLVDEGFAVTIKAPRIEGQDFADIWVAYCSQKGLTQ